MHRTHHCAQLTPANLGLTVSLLGWVDSVRDHGGIIFKMIDGPGTLPESNEYFVTKQNLTAQKLCEEFDFDYLKLDNKRKIKNTLKNFFEFDGRTKILELESSIDQNTSIFDNLKQTIKKSYEL